MMCPNCGNGTLTDSCKCPVCGYADECGSPGDDRDQAADPILLSIAADYEPGSVVPLGNTPYGLHLSVLRDANTARNKEGRALENDDPYTHVGRVLSRVAALLLDLESHKNGYTNGAGYWATIHGGFGDVLLALDDAAARVNCDLGLATMDAFQTRARRGRQDKVFETDVYLPPVVRMYETSQKRASYFVPAWLLEPDNRIAVVDCGFGDGPRFFIASRYAGLKMHKTSFVSLDAANDVARVLYFEVMNEKERLALGLKSGNQKKIGGMFRPEVITWIEDCAAAEYVVKPWQVDG